ncbi:MAG: crossover junction endodeoxyribonuclease RuvC [Thermoleophilia bacterium]|nr:crossover junction endodeoxyribonuclease RuvC [Thermoleophilia bacterium]
MTVLGIDPGLANTGYGVVRRAGARMEAVTWGTIRTTASTPIEIRLLALHDGLAAVLAANPVDSASIEAFFVHPVSTAAMGMAAARGALLVACAEAGIAVTEYSPNAIKQSVTGNGRADKQQVHAMVQRITGATAEGDHAADALAVAICHASAGPLQAAIGVRRGR